MDPDRKGYIEASDVQRLGSDVGKIDNEKQLQQQQGKNLISTDGANAMIETTNHMFAVDAATKNNNDDHKHNQQRLDSSVFQKLFAPPSP